MVRNERNKGNKSGENTKQLSLDDSNAGPLYTEHIVYASYMQYGLLVVDLKISVLMLISGPVHARTSEQAEEKDSRN